METTVNSSCVGAAVRRGAAATSAVPDWATPKEAASSGTLPSFTLVWASPTRSKENQPTRLANIVNTTAPPIPAYSSVEMRKRSSTRGLSRAITAQPHSAT